MAGNKSEGATKKGSSRSPSQTPPRRSRERGRSASRKGGNDRVVHERVIREIVGGGGGPVVYPTLTSTNYIDWALVMKINLRSQGLWEAMSGEGEPTDREDMAALAALLRAVPAEMVPVLANKETAHEAWEAVKLMRIGVDRAREATAQQFRREFEVITFKEGENLDAFGMRITTLANNLNRYAYFGQQLLTATHILAN